MCKLSVAVFLICVGYISAGDLLHGHHSLAAAPALGLGGFSSHYASAPAAVYQSGYGAGLGLGHSIAAAPLLAGASYGGASYGGASFGGASYGGASLLASAPAYGGASYGGASLLASAPAYGATYSAPAIGIATAKHVQYGQPSVQAVFAERAHVVPGQEIVYKVQAPPKIKKEVVQVAQVVHQPKVLYSEVVAPAKVDRQTVVVDQKPQIVSVQPNIHKESVVFVQPKAQEKFFVAQRRRDTVAKRTEYERHNFKTVHLNPNPEVKVVGVNQYEKAPSVSVHGAGSVGGVASIGAVYPSAGVSTVEHHAAPAGVVSHSHFGHHLPATGGVTHFSSDSGYLPSGGALLPSAGALFPSTASFLPSAGATITKVEQKQPASVTVVNEGSNLPSLSSSSSLLSGTKN